MFLSGACSDFLEEKSQDEVLVRTTTHYRELFFGGMGYSDIWHLLHVLGDEVQIKTSILGDASDNWNVLRYTGFYTWQPDMWEGENIALVTTYQVLYSQVMVMNAILDGIDNAEGSQEEKDIIKAEALGIRGFYYHVLVNLFGEPYNYNRKALGVPLKLTAGLIENGITRDNVEVVYNQIVKDLEESSRLFRMYPKQRGSYRMNGTTADILLSRVYLHMEEWEKSIIASTRAIETAEGLTDYTKLAEGVKFVTASYDNSEVEWLYGNRIDWSGGPFEPANTLWAAFGDNDCRDELWLTGMYINKIEPAVYKDPCLAVRISEAYLNRAEAHVLSTRADKKSVALEDLNYLRRHRIVGYNDVNIEDEEQLLDEIREERRRELCFDGLRWFDLRRYGMPSISHDYKTRKNAPWVTYMLREKDPLYTLPIPRVILDNNIKMEQNASAKEPARMGTSK